MPCSSRISAASLFVSGIFIGLILLASPSAAVLASDDEAGPAKRPNIVFLVCESTDGRTWRKGYQNDVIPLPNIRSLEEAGGYSFHRNYANSPVCCTSRSTFWSGRHAHKIPHVQKQSHTNSQTREKKTLEMAVDGAWNNFEGLPRDFDQRIDQVLKEHAGYETHISGKTDWSTGGHSRNVQMGAWTMYTQFPYNVYETGGWRLEESYICGNNGTVIPGNRSAHGSDWHTLNQTREWLYNYHQNETAKEKPFFVYQGMSIVHPPYSTNEHYYNKINPDKIRVPDWPPLEDLHPCDFQSSMLKGCIPPLNNATATEYYYSKERRRNIRRIYYAMIAEFDAMVGAYMQTVRDIDAWDNTIFIVTSDHGDQQMEHQQSYKMVPYDASSSVPLLIYDGRANENDSRSNCKKQADSRKSHVIDNPTQLIDLYPTIMDLAMVDPSAYPKNRLDGSSLVPLMMTSSLQDTNSLAVPGRPEFVVSQFHGMNIAMSWFLIVRNMPCIAKGLKGSVAKETNNKPDLCAMKLVIWGTGHEVDSQLFDLSQDPDELNNLIHDKSYASIISLLEKNLRSVVDYPRVAIDVARYNRESMKHWIDVMGEPDWRNAMHTNLRWDDSFNQDIPGAFQALEEWLNGTVEILPCRNDLVWPPPPSAAVATD